MTVTQTFTYDSLNRLGSAAETSTAGGGWTQINGYDRYGNRSIVTGGVPNFTFNSGNNRIVGKSYDAAGNMTLDGTMSFGYDAENRLITVNGVTGYRYDGEGKRVRKLIGEQTRFIYGMSGALVAEYDGTSGGWKKQYISGGGMTAQIEPVIGTRYTTADHLGTPRVVTDTAGNVVGRHDYQPFGEEVGSGIGGRTTNQGYSQFDGVRQGFIGYEKDGETGLNFAQARYHSPTHGRFTSPDPLLTSGQPYHPQSWNRYTYCLNSPLAYVDPTGLIWGIIGNGDVVWYEDKDAMDAAGATAWTELTYGIGNDQYVQLNANGPDANGSTQEARQGWSVYTQPSMQAGQPDNTGAFQLLFEYITGTGPTDRQFGSDTYMTQGMMTSPDVTNHRQNFINQGGGTYGPEAVRFGLSGEDGPLEAGFNMPRQFVGSFYMTITERPGGDALFVIDNTRHLRSALYNIPSVQPVERSTMAPLSTKAQTFWWVERGVIKR
jgi:RHS repeat-associated protein